MWNVSCLYILAILFALTSCGSNIEVETFGEDQKKTPFSLKAANKLEQSILENIGSCNFKTQNDPAYEDPLEFKISFSNEINSKTFSPSNINNIGTGGSTSISWDIVNCGDRKNFLLRATSVVGNGSIIPLIDVKGIKYIDGDKSKEFDSSDNSVTFTQPLPFTWMGYVDNNWSNSANWFGGVKPGASDVAIFNNACATNSCTVNIDEDVSVQGMDINVDFSGSITQAAGENVTLGTSGFNQNGGFYIVGANNFSVAGDFKVNSGVFNSSGSLVNFNGTSTGFIAEIEADGVNLNNVEFSFGGAGTVKTINLIGTLKVLGNLVMNTGSNVAGDQITGGEIDVEGNLTILNWDSHQSSVSIKMSGANSQTITAATGQSLSSLVIDKTGGTLGFAGDPVEVKRHFTYLGGNVNIGTTKFIFNHETAGTITPGLFNFYDVDFTHGRSITAVTKTIVGTMLIQNNLTLDTHANANSDLINGGVIDIKGDVNLIHSDIASSSTEIVFSGTADQTITQVVGDLPGDITINKPSGKVVLASNYTQSKANQDVRIQNGSVDMAGFNLTIGNDLTLESLPSQTYLYTNCGTLTVNGTTADLGSGIIPSGSNPTISISDASITEGGNLDFIVTLSEAVCGGNFTVNFTSDDASATLANSDYTDNDNILTIPPGNLTGTITIGTVVDNVLEADELIKVNLNTPSHGTLSQTSSTGTILNDDNGPFLWTGLGSGDNWSTAGNWQGGVVPGPGDRAYFDGTCTNCNALIDANLSVDGIALNSTYSGTITQANGVSLTIGAQDWIQAGGNFIGSDASIVINGDFFQSGGIFTATTALMQVGRSVSSSNPEGFIITGGTFNHNNGSMEWRWGTSNTDWSMSSSSISVPTSFSLYNLTLSARAHPHQRGNIIVPSDIVVKVENDITFDISGGGVRGEGRFDVAGDVSGLSSGGNSTIKLVGSFNQTIAPGTRFPGSLEIASTGGVVDISGDLIIRNDLTYTSGTVNTNDSHVQFLSTWQSSRACGYCANIDTDSVEFYDVTINISNTSDYGTTTILSNLNINNDLTLGGVSGSAKAVVGGDIFLKGDLFLAGHDFSGGTTNIHLVGTGNQAVSNSTTLLMDDRNDSYFPSIIVNSTGGVVSFTGNIPISNDFIYQAGTVDLSGSHFIFGEHYYGGKYTTDIDASTLNFNDVTFRKIISDSIITTGLNIDGSLVFHHAAALNSEVDGDPITVAKDVTFTESAIGGSASLILDGTGDQSISHLSGAILTGNISVNKFSGQVFQASNLNLSTVGQNLAIIDGDWNMAGFDLTINNNLDIANLPAQSYLYTNCGTLSVGGTTTDPGVGIISSGSNPNITISDESETEGTNQVFKVSLSEAVCASVTTIDYLTASDLATQGTDFTDTNGTLNIPAKSISGIITVPTIVDSNYEVDETFNLTISNTSNGTITDALGVGTILNDDLSNFTWTGTGGDLNWSTDGNWSGGTAPGSSDVAVFDSTCTNCNSNIDVNSSILGLFLSSNYTGTLTQNTGASLTIGIEDYIQYGGAFVGGDSIISIADDIIIHEGTFTSTSGDLSLVNDIRFFGGTQNFPTGRVHFVDGAENVDLVLNGASFNNVRFDKSADHFYGDDFTVNGSLYISNSGYSTIGMDITVLGDITGDAGAAGGSGRIIAATSGSQTITGVAGFFPRIEINSTGTVNLAGDIKTGAWVYTAGTVDPGTSEVTIRSTFWLNTGSMHFYDLKLEPSYNGSGSITGTILVDNNLTLNEYSGNSTINGGTIEVGGNLIVEELTNGGTTNIKMTGTNIQTINQFIGEKIPGTLIIDKSAGQVNLLSDVDLALAGQNMQIVSGDFNLAGYDLTVANDLDIANLPTQSYLHTNCGNLNVSGTITDPGSGIIVSSSNPNITISDESEIEGISHVFTVTLSEAVCASTTTIDYSTGSGSAIEGTDFTDTNGTLNIPAKALSGTIAVPTTVDANYEPDETFLVNLANSSHGSIIDSSGEGLIVNDDTSNFTWTGLSGDSKWSTDGNWSGGSAPGAAHVAVFDSTCTNCNSNVDVNVSVNSIVLEDGYTGTLTQEIGSSIAVGSGGITQFFGTFVGGDSLIEINKGNFKLAGGIFTSTSGVFDIENPDSGNRTAINIYAGTTFNHNNGTIKVSGNFNPGTTNAYINLDENISFYNLELSGNYGGLNASRMYLWNVSGSFNAVVLNDFGILGTNNVDGYTTLSNGIVEVRGDLYYDKGAHGTNTSLQVGTNGTILLNGAGDQKINAVANTFNGLLPNITIDKTSGTVEAGSGTTTIRAESISLLDGTFNVPNDLIITRKSGQISGDSIFNIASGAVFNSNNSNLKFEMYDNSSTATGNIDLASTITVNDLYFSTLYNSNSRSSEYSLTNSGIVVNNNFTVNSDVGTSGRIRLYGSNIEVKGNTVLGQGFGGGTTNLTFSGASDQTIDASNLVTNLTGNFNVNKSSGKVVQLSNIALVGASQDLILTAGDWDLAGYNLDITNDLTIANLPSQSYLHKSCGLLTVSGTTTDPGSGILTTGQNPNISINDPSSSEGDDLEFIVTLSEAVCGSAVTVDYASSNGSAIIADSDYVASSGTLNIPVGATSGIISLTTTSDSYAEENETVNMTLSSNSHGVISDSLGVGTILNDDGAIPVNIFRSTGFGSTLALSEGTDNSGTDLTISGSIATFEHGQSDDIGVGDAIQYDSSGDNSVDSIVFISQRVSSTQYQVQTVDGNAVADLGGADTDWAIFRAYTSLSNAENGVENTGIEPAVRDFDSWTGGKDLTVTDQIWNIAAYADAIDTSTVDINGWTTDKSKFIKIYSPFKSTEVGKSQRHLGIWSIGGFILDPGVTTSSSLTITEDFVHIEGIQVKCNDDTGVGRALSLSSGSGEFLNISDNIFRGPEQASGQTLGLSIDSTSPSHEFRIYNNLIYGFDGTSGYGLQVNGATPGMVYNNTFNNNVNSITVQTVSSEVKFKNNLIQNSITSSFSGAGGFHLDSDYNLSDDGNMPGANSITSSAVKFRSESSDELRLDSTDLVAKNAGIDLTSETIFLNDLMEHPRGTDGLWDIGAHEAAQTIYRSIGNGNFSSLETGSGNDLSISSGVVTFTTGVANNIGIGDAIQYDRSGDGSVDSLMFIVSRTNSTTFAVREKDNSIPADLAADDDWDIFRAYTSVFNATNLIENSGLDVSIRNFTDTMDLVGNNLKMIYSFYADAPFADLNNYFGSNWLKSPTTNINFYVPYKSTEVGVTQRHSGVWNSSFVHFTSSTTILWPSSFTTIDGIQLFVDNNTATGYKYGIRSSSDFTLKNSILRGPDSNISTSTIAGVYNGDTNELGVRQVFVNNIFYNWSNNASTSAAINSFASNINMVIYNNTFVNNERPIGSVHNGVLLINNISQDLISGFVGTFDLLSSNNLSFDTNAPGAGSVTNSTLTFVNKGSNNFNLAAGDSDAQSSGADLSSDGYFSFDKDIIQQSRPSADWDMGAFQY